MVDKYWVPAPSGPGIRTRFVRSAKIEEDQLEAVMASDVDLFACGIGAPKAALERAHELGKALGQLNELKPAAQLIDELIAEAELAFGSHGGN